jgi:DNA (cytosine-5)-methyltransferase 1
MRYLSVCAGIEAATVAWHDLGWQAAAFSEIEPFPSAVLKHHYPDVSNVGDMTKFKEWDIGTINLLVGGTPCQSFSVAGLRKGLDDPRGNLMLTYLAIAAKHRPRWLVWENVPGVLSSNGGKDFATFLGALGELGYGFAYRVLDAQYFGVAQRRRRVFVVGCLGDWRSAAAVLFERESLSGNIAPSRKTKKDVAGPITAGIGKGCRGTEGVESNWAVPVSTFSTPAIGNIKPDEVASCISRNTGAGGETQNPAYVVQPVAYNITFCDANGIRKDRPNGGLYINETEVTSTLTKAGIGTNAVQNMAVRRLTPVECERLQGFPDNYTNIPWRNKPESPDGPRYKSLGNSMAVPVMKWIGQRIKMVDELC